MTIMDKFVELNSATKYPSIETYHVLGERGALTEDVGPFAGYEGDALFTEKVNGTNGRIVLFPDGDFLIGSREELWYADGDRIINPSFRLVETLKPVAEGLTGDGTQHISVFFFEVYGHQIGSAAKQYTGEGNVGYRLFDLAYVPLEVLELDRARIASWRQHGGQQWATEPVLQRVVQAEGLTLAPRLGTVQADSLPTSVAGMSKWLEQVSQSLVGLDAKAKGRSEGVVLRSPQRTVIAKARFEDYERTLNPQPQRKQR
jgi:hypothetical protein